MAGKAAVVTEQCWSSMKHRQPLYIKLKVLLLFLAMLVLASWFMQAAEIEPWQRLEGSIIVRLGIKEANYQLLKAGIFIIALLVFLFLHIYRRKAKKMKIPKI
jgi:hypothetical protein